MKKLTILVGLLVWLFAPSHAKSQTVFGPETFTRTTGEPQTITRTFSLPNPGAEYTLIIENGGDGGARVSSAIVGLNGVIIAGPDEFNQNVNRIVKSVLLGQTNTLYIELRSKPGSSITISIETGAAAAIFPRFTLFTNRTDPELLRAETADGQVIDYFGVKDDKGLAVSLNIVRVQDAQGRITTVDLDDQERPVLIHCFNGTIFKITHLSNTSLVVKVLSDDGIIETDVPVSLPGGTQPNNLSSTRQSSSGLLTTLSSVTSTAAVTFAQPTSTVIVKHCGVPVNNADVSMLVKTSTGINFTMTGTFIENGTYKVPIPTPDRSALNRQEQKCIRVAQVLGIACASLELLGPLTQLICPAITVAVAAIPFADVTAPAIFIACESAMAALEVYCHTLGASPGVGGPDLAELLCHRIRQAIDRASIGPVVLIPTVKIIGEEPRSNLAINPPDGPFTTFTFDFPCGCASGLGRKYFAPGGDLKIKVLPFQAEFTNEIRLLVHGQSRTLATNRDVGRVVDLGSFDQGTELIFYIHVRDTGFNFFMGPAARNRDAIAHARLDCLGGGNANVFFEDFLGGGDRDYDDADFEIIASP